MGTVELIGTCDARWKRLCETTDADDYQLPGWAEISAHCEGGEPCGLYGCRGDGEFLIPLIVRDLPESFTDSFLSGWRDATSPYGYPGAMVSGVLDTEGDRLSQEVAAALCAERILTCFVRMNPVRANATPLLEALGITVDGNETVFYDLTLDETVLWTQMRREHKRDIGLLRESGYQTRADVWTDYPAFKALYRSTMERVGARSFYLFDDFYFERMPQVLGDRLHLLSVVAPGGEVVSAGLFLTGGEGTAHSHLTGTSAALPHASKLLYDASWRWHRARGVRALHMGGGLGRPNDSLLNFKRGLARGRTIFRTARVISDPDRYCIACQLAGTNPNNVCGFFPAYRKPADESAPPVKRAPAPAPSAEEARL